MRKASDDGGDGDDDDENDDLGNGADEVDEIDWSDNDDADSPSCGASEFSMTDNFAICKQKFFYCKMLTKNYFKNFN